MHGQTQQQERGREEPERSAKLSPPFRGEEPFLVPVASTSEVEKIILGRSCSGAISFSANNIVGQEDINNFAQDIDNFQRRAKYQHF